MELKNKKNFLTDGNMERYAFVVPVMKTLLKKLKDRSVNELFVGFNINSGPEFYEKFQDLCRDQQWITSMENKVCEMLRTNAI